jgi:hypothetical protein
VIPPAELYSTGELVEGARMVALSLLGGLALLAFSLRGLTRLFRAGRGLA